MKETEQPKSTDRVGKSKGAPWPDPGDPDASYGTAENLYDQVRSYLKTHLGLTNETEYDILACWTLASYRLNEFTTVCYLFFLGPPGSGKTRGLECLQQLCYRGTLVSSISPSALFRAVDKWHPTVLIDESEIYSNEHRQEILAILNAGYRQGQVVVRSVPVADNQFDVDNFDVYGFKALAGIEEMTETLRSRCITILMQRAECEIPVILDKLLARKIRRWLQHYMLQRNGAKIDPDSLIEKIRDPRVVELFLPLVGVAPTKNIRDKLIEYEGPSLGYAPAGIAPCRLHVSNQEL